MTTHPWLRAELIAAPETTPGAQLMIPADGIEFHDGQLVFHHQGEVVYIADQGQLRSITWFAKQPNPELARRKSIWPNHGTRWTDDQRADLLRRIRLGQSWPAISAAAGRSRTGCQQEAVKQGWLDPDTLHPRPELMTATVEESESAAATEATAAASTSAGPAAGPTASPTASPTAGTAAGPAAAGPEHSPDPRRAADPSADLGPTRGIARPGPGSEAGRQEPAAATTAFSFAATSPSHAAPGEPAYASPDSTGGPAHAAGRFTADPGPAADEFTADSAPAPTAWPALEPDRGAAESLFAAGSKPDPAPPPPPDPAPRPPRIPRQRTDSEPGPDPGPGFLGSSAARAALSAYRARGVADF